MTMSEKTSLGHMPESKWAFDEEVTGCFDDMLERSIPQYEVMRDAVCHVARRYAVNDSAVADIGCSHGEALARVRDAMHPSLTYLGIDVSEPMVDAARARFDGCDDVQIGLRDLRDPLILRERTSVVMSVLTLQFTPIEHRQRIVRDVHDWLMPGGAFIVVEKVLGETAGIDTAMVKTYLEMKERNGYSREEIDRKRLALEGVLVPVTAKWNEELLRMAGFREVDCFWRWMNFAAWVAIK